VTRADGLLSLLSSAKPLKDRARVHLHSHTAETLATVVLYDKKQISAGEQAFAQLRLADSILLLPGDHFVIRQFSPVVTIGGGLILDVASRRAESQRRRLWSSSERCTKARPKLCY